MEDNRWCLCSERNFQVFARAGFVLCYAPDSAVEFLNKIKSAMALGPDPERCQLIHVVGDSRG